MNAAYQSGATPVMSALLMAYEKDCAAARLAAPDLSVCVDEAYRQLGRSPDGVFAEVNRKIIDLLEADAKQAEHAYHNRHHVRDVVCAVVLLLLQGEPAVTPHVVDCMITAALGHDLHHDGLGTMSQRDVERRSATAVLAIAKDAGLPQADMGFIEGLILATYPPIQRRLREKLAQGQGTDPEDMMALVFGEADVLASLTPTFGKILSISLSAEWRKAGLIFPSMPDDDAGRALFLGLYRHLTPSARRLGVEAMVLDQMQILQRNVS